MTTMELPDPIEPAMDAAWDPIRRPRREVACEKVRELLLTAARAWFAGDKRLHASLYRQALDIFDEFGMHGPVIRDEIERIGQEVHEQARREYETRTFFAMVKPFKADLPHWTGKDCYDPVLHHRLERDAAQEKRQPVVHVDGLCSWCDGSTKGGWR